MDRIAFDSRRWAGWLLWSAPFSRFLDFAWHPIQWLMVHPLDLFYSTCSINGQWVLMEINPHCPLVEQVLISVSHGSQVYIMQWRESLLVSFQYKPWCKMCNVYIPNIYFPITIAIVLPVDAVVSWPGAQLGDFNRDISIRPGMGLYIPRTVYPEKVIQCIATRGLLYSSFTIFA